MSNPTAITVQPGTPFIEISREFEATPVFHTVAKDVCVVQIFEFEGAPGQISLETVTYTDLGGRTRLHTRSVFPSVEARDAMLAAAWSTASTTPTTSRHNSWRPETGQPFGRLVREPGESLSIPRGKRMGWKTLGVAAAVVVATVATATPALAGTPHWEVSALPLPPGLTQGSMGGSDGHGGYAGMMLKPDSFTLVTWKDGRATDHGMPPGVSFGSVAGESSGGQVLVYGLLDAGGTKLYMLDGTGYHEVVTGRYTRIQSAVMGPRGDIAVKALDPAGQQSSSVVLYWSPLGQAGLRPLAGAPADSTPASIDYDGTVLLGDDTASYLVHNGTARRLTTPAGFGPSSGATVRHGVVVGTAVLTDQPGAMAMMWSGPDYVGTPLENSGSAHDVNASGRIAGAVYAPNVQDGPAGVWQGTKFLTELPPLPGTKLATARFVDDDGAIAGWSSEGAVDEGGQPVVWRLVSSA